MKRAKREEWATRVARWKESGLAATAFAAEIGVNAKTLTWWRTQFARTTSPDAPKRALARRRDEAVGKAATTGASLNFVELAASAESEPLEVVLPTSVRVCVRPGFDTTTLLRLLDVLDSRRR